MKLLWAYLKKNNLKCEDNKQYFIPDKKMAKIFGKDKMRGFGMAKFLGDHLTPIGGELRGMQSDKPKAEPKSKPKPKSQAKSKKDDLESDAESNAESDAEEAESDAEGAESDAEEDESDAVDDPESE